jgi:uncharacterized membrane protein YbhN (UPF0104 family)
VAVAGAAVVALLVFRGPHWGAVGHALTQMRWSWALAAIGINLASALVRGLAWRTVVVEAIPPPYPSLLDFFSAVFVGIFANGVLPGRVGEVARVGVLRRHLPGRRGLWPPLIGSVVAHRLLEIFPSIGLILWVLADAKIPAWGRGSLLAVLGLGVALLLAGLLLARRHEHGEIRGAGRIRAVIVQVRQGLGVLRSPGPAAQAIALQTAAWMLQLGAVWTAMRAFNISLPLTAAAAVLALMNVALILPLWPGNVGLQQAAIALPLVPYGIPYAHGFAYGIGLQAIESSVGYVGGVVFLLREGLSLAGLREMGAGEAASDDGGAC